MRNINKNLFAEIRSKTRFKLIDDIGNIIDYDVNWNITNNIRNNISNNLSNNLSWFIEAIIKNNINSVKISNSTKQNILKNIS